MNKNISFLGLQKYNYFVHFPQISDFFLLNFVKHLVRKATGTDSEVSVVQPFFS